MQLIVTTNNMESKKMEKLSTKKLTQVITTNRKKLGLTQQELADKTGINRSMISHIESEDYVPSIPQLEQLSSCLDFDITDLFVENNTTQPKEKIDAPHNIAVAGTGYVGM